MRVGVILDTDVSKKIKLENKKGIASIVGGIFFLVLMTSGFTVYYVALDSQSQMLNTQQIIADVEVNKIREKFTISVSTDSNNRLGIQVTNEGNNVVEIVDVWIINKTAITQPAIKTEVKYNDAFIPAGFSGDILANTPLYLAPDEHDIKVVSILGTIVTEKKFVPGSPGEGGNVLVTPDLFGKPGIFMIIPSPFGESRFSEEGLWGVNVVNPTSSVMNVTMVVITLHLPAVDDAHKMFNDGDDVTDISPGDPPATTKWEITMDNQLTWENINNPISIPSRSVYPFLVKVPTNDLEDTNESLKAMPVVASVVTSLGQFGKAGYISSMRELPEVIANVFLGNGLGTTSNDNINSIRMGIPAKSMETFNVWLADFESGPNRILGQSSNAMSSLIINVPPGWDVPNPPTSDADWEISYISLADGSSQIIGKLKNDIVSEGKKITFTAQAPDVASTKMYVMYVVASGETNNSFTVGPLAEFVLQVCPTPPCS